MAGDINISAVPPQQPSPAVVAQEQKVSVQEKTQQADKVAEVAAEDSAVTAEELKKSIDQLNDFMKGGQRSLAFSVDDSADEVVIRVVDTSTQEVIRQIPNEEALRLKMSIEETIGLLFSDKA